MYKNSIIILFLFIFLFGCITTPEREYEEIDYEKTIIEDATNKHPNADIVEIESVDVMDGLTTTNVRVSYYVDTICPERYRLRYKYPEFGYETGIPIEIVKNCEYKYTPDSVITYKEQAIVAAHSLKGTEDVKDFIGNGEYIFVETTFHSDVGVWEVLFNDEYTLDKMRVTLRAKNPQVLTIKKIENNENELE
jgi:hypothetical protein